MSIFSEEVHSNFAKSEISKAAFKNFAEAGLPTTRDEDWKYTSLAKLEKAGFAPASGSASIAKDQITEFILEDLFKTHLVFVDGVYQEGLSNIVSEEGLVIKNISSISDRGEFEKYLAKTAGSNKPLVSLNTAYINDGAFIVIEKDAELSSPVHLVFVNTQDKAAINSRVLIVAEENSKSEIVETYVGLNNAEYLTSNVTEIFVKKNAESHHYRVLRESDKATHISNIEVEQEDSSRFLTHAFNFGGKLIRNDISAVVNGEEVFTGLYGLNVASDEQHIDNNTVLDHAEPNCESDEQYRGIYGGKSKGIFSGTIIVRQDAQKTNAIQSNQSVLLSDDAESNSRPQLKIWADDVRCTHGATVGQLDDDALFYLRSRGIPKNEARNILVHAFASDVVNQVEHQILREYLEGLLTEKLDNIAG